MLEPPPANLERIQSEISTPQNRIRWATKRETEAGGIRKRQSLLRRWGHHRRTSSAEKRANAANSKRTSTAETENTATEEPRKSDSNETEESEEVHNKRRVFFNLPLPDDVRDEDGKPKEHFARNKIRTAKYTPLSFIPKNLYYQFHNVANLYFLFIIILGVSCSTLPLDVITNMSSFCRLFLFLALPILHSMQLL
jgi:phospholipid-translocating ATPase